MALYVLVWEILLSPKDLSVARLTLSLRCWGNGLDLGDAAYFEIQGSPHSVLLDPGLLSLFASYPWSKEVFSVTHSHSYALPCVELEEMKPISQGLILPNHEPS